MESEETFDHFVKCIECQTSFQQCDPRILPCLHSLCTGCVENLEGQETVLCPYCSEHLDWNPSIVEHLPTDHHRGFVLEYMKIVSGKHDDLICKKCKKDKSSVRCQECQDTLCQACLKAHSQFLKDHTVLTFDEMKGKKFHALIATLICEDHKFPLEKYCNTDQRPVCNICEVTVHNREENHIVENISMAYTEKKKELAVNVAECRKNLEAVIDQKVNAENEIANLNQIKEKQTSEIDASINNLTEVLKKRQNELKDDLKYAIESREKKWKTKLTELTDVEYKLTESLRFAEKSFEYLGPEDFCQTEGFISERLRNLSSKGRKKHFNSSEIKLIAFARGDVAVMNQLLISNNWLSLFEYNLHVSDKIAHISTDDKEIIIGKLQISVAKGKNLNATHCPLKGVVKGKDDRETDCKTVFNDSEECYFITSELTTSGDYSLQILLNDKILHQQPFKFTLISSEDIHAPEQKSYGSKERIDELGPVFMEQEMQCPNCKESFSLNDEESFPRVLPCLHIMGTNCILKEIKNRSVQCAVCEAKHSVPDGDLTCFPKDETRKNLSIYWHLRSEEDYVPCTEHKSARATFLCQKCGEFVCEVCSGSHLGDTHPPLVRVPKLEALKETPVSKLYSYHPCEAEGHEDRMLELFCITCEKLICHECHFDVHQKHKVDKVKAVYEKRRVEIRDILEKAIKTKAIATAVASETRDELEALGKNVGQELNEVRKVFNNCKTKLDARKKTVENELTSKASTKENKMRSQLTDLEDLERSIEISSNRALDLIEFSSEVSFLKLFTTLKKRLGTVSDSCRRSYVCENGLIKYLDDNISDKIVKITNQPGRVWSCSVCLPKTKHWTFPAVAKERAEVLKLQFVDYEEKTTSPANFKEFIKTEVFDSKGQNTPQVLRETVYSEDMLSVRATFSEPGDYRMMVHVLDTPVTKSGYTIHVQKEVEKKAKISNRENESKTTERDISRGSDVLREYHKEDLKDGDRVVRGPTWKWEDQGGVAGTKGTVKLIDSKAYDGWLQVTWDNGDVNVYRKDASHADVILAPSAEQQ